MRGFFFWIVQKLNIQLETYFSTIRWVRFQLGAVRRHTAVYSPECHSGCRHAHLTVESVSGSGAAGSQGLQMFSLMNTDKNV